MLLHRSLLLRVASLALLAAPLALASTTMPPHSIGFYLLLADDTVENYTSTDDWVPKLHPYQQTGANVFYLTFINPANMSVPPAFARLAKSKGSSEPGAVPSDATVMFSVGGYAYSSNPDPWPFLETPQAARAMAAEVATWPEKYGCDGIDLDIETGAGDASGAGANLVEFIKALKAAKPKMIISQPVFGYPQVKAENEVVNESWDANATSQGLADLIGIMVYSGTGSLQWVKNYVNATSQWQGFPIHSDVPPSAVVVGLGGAATATDLDTAVAAILSQSLRGVMVWYASVLDAGTGKAAIQYSGGTPDASTKANTSMWSAALSKLLAKR